MNRAAGSARKLDASSTCTPYDNENPVKFPDLDNFLSSPSRGGVVFGWPWLPPDLDLRGASLENHPQVGGLTEPLYHAQTGAALRQEEFPMSCPGYPVGSVPASTVGRNRPFGGVPFECPRAYEDRDVRLYRGDALHHYPAWEPPQVIISDGAYGILGFEGDTVDHSGLPAWYEAHVAAWSKAAKADTTLWFWNSEIGWAAMHATLERHGWRYVNCNIPLLRCSRNCQPARTSVVTATVGPISR